MLYRVAVRQAPGPTHEGEGRPSSSVSRRDKALSTTGLAIQVEPLSIHSGLSTRGQEAVKRTV